MEQPRRMWFVYIISNNAHTLYVGMTNDVARRFEEHKSGIRTESTWAAPHGATSGHMKRTLLP